jgi:septum formation protein
VIDRSRPLLLGSASPRRRELLETLGLPFVVSAPVVDEASREAEAPDDYVSRVVDAKLEAARGLREAAQAGAVLVADTIVVVDGLLLGKPEGRADAERMLRALSGRPHEVTTRFAVSDAVGSRVHRESVTTRVFVRSLTDDERRGYVASGEGDDKAGAYAIQGLGAFLVERIEGSYGAVVGLPACELVRALRGLGLLTSFPLS